LDVLKISMNKLTLIFLFGLFASNLPLGEHILKISKLGYIVKRFPIIINEGGSVVF